MKDEQHYATPVPKSPALRRLSQIDLSFFSPSSPFRSSSNRGRVSPAFDFCAPVKSPFVDAQGPVGKSTRKRKTKPRLTKRTMQILSFLEYDGVNDKENRMNATPKKASSAFPRPGSKTPMSARKFAAMNLNRKQQKGDAVVIGMGGPGEPSPYGLDYDRFGKGLGESVSPRDDGKRFVPVYKTMALYRRSERMDHNIKLGLDLHEYLIKQGLTPTRATRMARPYFMDDAQLRTPPPSLSPFRQSARLLFGHDSVIPTPKQ